jgi:hypothetical protein
MSAPDRMTRIAMELQKLGIAHHQVVLMLGENLDEIERQLAYLPHRKARRPGAFLIEAVRRRYSAPPTFYATTHAHPSTPTELDEDSQHTH